ncbi:hypothetical protein SAMN04489729_8248 [Amycolatopsis lurida]|uniref:Lipoprotein n=1 Tax=Amycolatopsis lurida NRRL 2430 TaxID=1460371 RepID=A0A2P2FNQ3_AMYLU|nr:hypothetical protein [Amycolatopsis lurida]KFU78342.1 hypothetical protein BB31_25875 [Amycolatopsis lurida NRRL 2430]SEE59314.1 hypothetical protein SAMN04489729_8248 [Amycolatopsis lurida]
MRRCLTAAASVLALLTGCSAEQEPPPAKPVYDLPAREVRPDETALHLPPALNGETEFSLIGLAAGLPSLTGSHAEFEAKGQFVRLRLVVTGKGLSGILFDTRRQQLVTDSGAVIAVDNQAMTIKRQPDKFELGRGVRVEFDLYFDLPKEAKPLVLRAFGGPTLTDMKNLTGTDIKLT